MDPNYLLSRLLTKFPNYGLCKHLIINFDQLWDPFNYGRHLKDHPTFQLQFYNVRCIYWTINHHMRAQKAQMSLTQHIKVRCSVN